MELIKILKLDNKKGFSGSQKNTAFLIIVDQSDLFFKASVDGSWFKRLNFLNFIFLVSDHVITLPLIVFHSTVRCSSLLTLLDGYSE